MSAKAKPRDSKTGNSAPDLAEAVAINTPAIPTEAAAPSPESKTLATSPLTERIRAATGKAVVGSFASVRTAQATAIQRAIAWVTAFDTKLSASLVATEQFLLSKLQITPPAA